MSERKSRRALTQHRAPSTQGSGSAYKDQSTSSPSSRSQHRWVIGEFVNLVSVLPCELALITPTLVPPSENLTTHHSQHIYKRTLHDNIVNQRVEVFFTFRQAVAFFMRKQTHAKERGALQRLATARPRALVRFVTSEAQAPVASFCSLCI